MVYYSQISIVEGVSNGTFKTMAKNVGKAVSAPRVTPEMTEEMQGLRMQELEQNIPVKTKSDFESDEAYKEYLLQTYENLRQAEYGYTVRNETMKVYNLACDGASATGKKDNELVWNGYKSYIAAAKTPEEKERRIEQVQNSAMSRAAVMGGICMLGSEEKTVMPSAGLHCCALTASAITAQISGKMGYDGADNLVVPEYRGEIPGARNNIVAAAYISKADSILLHQQRIPEMIPEKPKTAKEKTLNERVRSGELGVGDSFAIKVGGVAGNTASGNHAMVIADVIKDEQGNVTSYVLQANNNRCLKSINVNDTYNYYGSKMVTDIVKTHEFVKGKVGQELENLKGLSLEELEARVVEQRGKTEQVIADLAVTEQYNAQRGYNRGIENVYLADLEKKREVAAQMPDEALGRKAPEIANAQEFVSPAVATLTENPNPEVRPVTETEKPQTTPAQEDKEAVSMDNTGGGISSPETSIDKAALHSAMSADSDEAARKRADLLLQNSSSEKREDWFAYFKGVTVDLDPYALIEKYNEGNNPFERSPDKVPDKVQGNDLAMAMLRKKMNEGRA